VEVVDFVDASGRDLTGEVGQVIGRDGSDRLVQTFAGLEATVPVARLQEHRPPRPEDGGFDACWPQTPDLEPHFVEAALGCLAARGFCLVQTLLGPQDREEAVIEATYLEDFEVMREEIEEAYLGEGCNSKVSRMDMLPAGKEPDGPLQGCDQMLTILSEWLAGPSACEFLGFDSFERTPAFVRLPRGERAVERMDYADFAEGKVAEAIDFWRRRKLCMLHVVEGSEGEIRLFPRETGNLQQVTIPVSGNKLLLFRHDLMGYTFRPEGTSLALQTWVLCEPVSVAFRHLRGDAKLKAALMGLTGPARPGPEGPASSVMSVMARMPGSVYGKDQLWSMFVAGTDTCVRWPRSRWEEEPYYSPEVGMPGRSCSVHGAFMDQYDVSWFDRDLFGITLEEATVMCPEQRVVLETGYDALAQAGYSRQSLQGATIGVYVGDVGCEELLPPPYSPFLPIGISGAATATRLSFTFGIQGPTVGHDTACSSSLMAMGFAHSKLRGEYGRSLPAALVVGVNLHMTPIRYIVLGSGGFLTKLGRCFTFDQSTDGYCRGEGCGAALVRTTAGEEDEMLRYACVAGSALNQDGRSASLTAPNGPSQQSVIRMSLRVADIAQELVGAAECHGTGTSLGDPIEVGALVAVLKPRSLPILLTTHKTNMGHPEANAGIAGVAKCVLSLENEVGLPNVHLRALSPHVHMEGFPHSVSSEIMDPRRSSQVMGVSSFGFGGSNARADFWGRSTNGPGQAGQAGCAPEASCPRCMGPMCPLCNVAVPHPEAGARHCCSLIREDPADYGRCSNCYQGRYKCGRTLREEGNPGRRVFVRGTWDAWSSAHEMEQTVPDTYELAVALGEAPSEQFYVLLDRDAKQAIYPAVHRADASACVLGPDDKRGGKYWVIQGAAAAQGRACTIRFEWTERKLISWSMEDRTAPAGQVFEHRYHLSGTWAAWQPQVMQHRGEGLHEGTFSVSGSCCEDFRILRDGDPGQAIYPAAVVVTKSVPVRGPDDQGEDKHWRVLGEEGERVTVRLNIQRGSFAVTIDAAFSSRTRTYSSPVSHTYHIVGSFDRYEPRQMQPVAGAEDIYTYRFMMGRFGIEDLCILVDGDKSQVMYPAVPEADSGQAMLRGPDKDSLGRSWAVRGRRGDVYEVVLDLNQEDRRLAVQWIRVPSGR